MANYTTRSAIETGHECRYKRYLNYFHSGTGIVPVGEFVPLTTGVSIHRGTERRHRGEDIETALRTTLIEHHNTICNSGYYNMNSYDSQFILSEQSALVEVLTRAWDLVERPKLDERFETLEIEKEYQLPLDRNGELILLSKPDRILIDKKDGSLYTYSLKSISQWNTRMDDSYRVELQGKTEALVASIVNKQKILATKFCFLIKGKRYKRLETRLENGAMIEREFHQTDNPLIYGYRTIQKGNCRFSYAFADKTVKPQNMSGFGRLGRDWQKFRVWETKGGVKKWLEILSTNRIQPELRTNPIKSCVVTPVEVHRTREELKSTLVQIQNEEKRVFAARDAVLNGVSVESQFPMNLRACYWPEPCEYLRICPNGNAGIGGKLGTEYDVRVAADPLGSGEFIRRQPHYEMERLKCSEST